MSSHSRRQLLRSLGALVTGTGVTSAVEIRSTTHDRPDDAVEWHRTYGDQEFQCHTVVDTAAGVLLVGRTDSDRSGKPWIAEIGPDGDPIWTTAFRTQGYTRAVDAVEETDGYTFLVTSDESPAIRVRKLDQTGQKKWEIPISAPEMTVKNGERHFATNTYKDNAHVLFADAGGYLIGGFQEYTPDGSNREQTAAWIQAIDNEGETRWNRLYDGTAVSGLAQFGNNVLVTGGKHGDAWMQLISTAGEGQWQHVYGGVEEEMASVAVPTASGILYGGRSHSVADRHTGAILAQTTETGEFVWRRTYDPLHVTDLLPFQKGFVMTGEPASESTGRNPAKPVILLDGWGRVQATATVSVDPGAPTGLGRFGQNAVAVGGWDSDNGIWLAKLQVSN